jgi:hypothetical protein
MPIQYYCVYVVQSPYDLKIGITKNGRLRNRMVSLRCEADDIVVKLVIVTADPLLERRLQHRFEKYCRRGEWFVISHEMLTHFDYLRYYADKYGVIYDPSNGSQVRCFADLMPEDQKFILEYTTRRFNKRVEVNMSTEAYIRQYQMKKEMRTLADTMALIVKEHRKMINVLNSLRALSN